MYLKKIIILSSSMLKIQIIENFVLFTCEQIAKMWLTISLKRRYFERILYTCGYY